MSSNSTMNEIVDKITLASTVDAFLSPELIELVKSLLEQQDDQMLCRTWQYIFVAPNADRKSSALQAFGYHEPSPGFEGHFGRFIQSLLSAIWSQDQQTALILAETLSSLDTMELADEPQKLSRLDVILMNDAMINARTRPQRSEDVEQTFVDRYGLPADSTSGQEGEDWFYHDTDEVDCKLAFLRFYFAGDLVKWNERDHADGLYGDPQDLSISGSETGWVVQKQVREGQREKTSGGRLPGSYNSGGQMLNLSSTDVVPSSSQDRGHALQQQTLNQHDSSSIGESPLLNDQSHTSPPQPDCMDTRSHRIVSADVQLPTQSSYKQNLAFKSHDRSPELNDRDRKLLEDYRQAFEVREEQFRADRRRKAREKKRIRTNSEVELAAQQSLQQ